MNLLENDLTDMFVSTYDVSIGYIDSSKDITIADMNNGIIGTNAITKDKIAHVSEVEDWSENNVLLKNKFYKNENRIYVCLYTPGTPSIIAPGGNLQSNIILDDNYVWRYIVDVQQVIDNKYIVPEVSTFKEVIRKGTVSSINILYNSNNQITNYAGFFPDYSHTNGSGLNFVVENDQSTLLVSDVLVQNGGTGYSHGDIISITDTEQKQEDIAEVNVYIEDGKVKLSSFTNGNNYNYMDIIIIGDGEGAQVTFSTIAGVLTNININGGTGYTWAKAIVLNSEVYLIAELEIEPLNGYNSDLVRHLGPNKYIISSTFKTDKEINYYGIHRKNTNDDKYIFFDNIYVIDEFIPEPDEEVTVRLLLGN